MTFLDTNVLLYAVSQAPGEAAKAEVARDILGGGSSAHPSDAAGLGLSTQVLAEFYAQATRSSRPDPLSHEQAAGLITAFSRFEVQAVTVAVVHDALRVRGRYGISFWDAQIVATARLAGHAILLSEDLTDGQDYDGVIVRNPFRGT